MIGKKNLKVEELADGRSRVSGKCVFTGEPYHCTVPTSGLAMWQGGSPIHQALPDVSPDDREFILSGISPAGWKKYFG